MLADLLFAFRQLTRSRAAGALILTLIALGVAAAAIVFTLFDAVMLRSLPVRYPEELVRVVQQLPRLGVHPLLGRTLEPDDSIRTSGTAPAVLSYDFWRQRAETECRAIWYATMGEYYRTVEHDYARTADPHQPSDCPLHFPARDGEPADA